MEKYSKTSLDEIAQNRGGSCISIEYIGKYAQYIWRCESGHVWNASFYNVLNNNSWCPECAGNKRKTIKDMKLLASKNGGRCLSSKYVNSKTRLLWECNKNHQWETIPEAIIRGTWCPECAGNKRKTIKDMKLLASKNGGRCLSSKYVNSNTKLLWECNKKHQWETTPTTIQSGTWCPECAGTGKKTIKDMRQIAKSRGGECTSNSYESAHKILKWRCALAHEWGATYASIKRGSWCNICSSSYNLREEMCRIAFETIFDTSFPKTQPDWLINDRGNRMELDGFSRELGIAFEYQGEQHYNYGNLFINTEKGLLQRKMDDERKTILCQRNSTKLIHITYKDDFQDLVCIIRSLLIKQNIDLRNLNFPSDLDFSSAYKSMTSWTKLGDTLKNKKGTCLTEPFKGTKSIHTFSCSKNHQWETIPEAIIRGTWCPECAGNKRKTIKDMKLLASKNGGRCLSSKYVNSNTKLLWECNKKHQWSTIPSLIRRGSWCPECARQRKKRLIID